MSSGLYSNVQDFCSQRGANVARPGPGVSVRTGVLEPVEHLPHNLRTYFVERND